MGHHREITDDQISGFVDDFNISHPSADGTPRVRWTSSSMRNAFGLRFVYLFFNMPFLYLQRETLQRQLETNTEEIRCSDVELDCYHETPDADYETFMDAITQRRRRAAEVTGASALCSSPGPTNQQPIGGGRPIPGTESLSHTPSPSTSHVQDSSSFSGSSSFEPTLSSIKTSATHREPSNTLPITPAYNGSDDECTNRMVRIVDEDFETDDELKEKMSRLATITDTNALSYYQDLPLNTTYRYEAKLENYSRDSQYDSCSTKKESDEPITFNISAKSEIARELLDRDVSSVIATSACTSTSEFNAWLGDDDNSSSPDQKKSVLPDRQSSEEEIGMKPLPSLFSSYSADVTSTLSRAASTPSSLNGEKTKKKKRSGGKSVGKKKARNVIVSDQVDGRYGNSEANSKKMNVLEEFLEGTELAGYDPL
ncbi:hypothetical protein KIN20_033571 [Parelaphostrongylus tenuis]|uniref:Uncharacterized protein n=1 Tax=Parelaphostrongylus tenuis TaxID=148309 RepID=A0AAD5R8C6_PARTN|nr:hypothetical protein KIN20_033571 [Parelaphostrongylus tenuis]